MDGLDTVEEALVAWRSLDLDDSAATEAAEVEAIAPPADDLPPVELRARPEFEFGTDVAVVIREIAGSVEEPATEGDSTRQGIAGLIPGSIDGLDAELCLVLAAAGIESLEELAIADPMALSQELGVGYTHVWRLTCLARRALEIARPVEQSTDAQAAPSDDAGNSARGAPSESRLSPSEMPRKPSPSILELEWKHEIRPVAPPPGRGASTRSSANAKEREIERENAGGPFA